ncbi:hypothetical protein DL98DRAFT_625540 [Cadophora sp. DSE1049]|nr:hypothetical protein DL98DRAFT_625540 [Cadophora sp. DSE1049]
MPYAALHTRKTSSMRPVGLVVKAALNDSLVLLALRSGKWGTRSIGRIVGVVGASAVSLTLSLLVMMGWVGLIGLVVKWR